jgi:hypothetical protein
MSAVACAVYQPAVGVEAAIGIEAFTSRIW